MNLRRSAVILILFIVTMALVMAGLVTLTSSSASLLSKNPKGNTYIWLGRQLMWLAFGLGLMGLSTQFDYNLLRPWARRLLLLTIGLLVAVLWVGPTVKGATRWLVMGPIGMQPSELAKLTLILYLAESWSRRYEDLDSFWRGAMPSFLVIGTVIGLIFPQPDKGTAFFLGFVCVVLWFIAGGRLKRIIPILAILIVTTLVLVLHDSYSSSRIRAFLNPDEDTAGRNYHVHQSKKALANGGWFGVGIGEGRQKLGFIPESHTDFIFSVYAEELGFVGCVVMLAFFSAIVTLAVYVGLCCEDLFGSLLAAGCGLCIGLQVLLNIAVVTGCIPTTGISLPLFMVMVGLIINVARSTLRSSPASVDQYPRRPQRRHRMGTAPVRNAECGMRNAECGVL